MQDAVDYCPFGREMFLEMVTDNKFALRKGGPGEASSLRFDIDESSDKSVAEQLRQAMDGSLLQRFQDSLGDAMQALRRDEQRAARLRHEHLRGLLVSWQRARGGGDGQAL